MQAQDLTKLTKAELIETVELLQRSVEGHLEAARNMHRSGQEVVKANTEMGEKIKELQSQAKAWQGLSNRLTDIMLANADAQRAMGNACERAVGIKQ